MSTIDLEGISHHPVITEIVDVLCRKTQNTDRGFFNVEVAYFLAKMAACMHATIVTKDRGELPVNIYALNLATSGYGKGHSVHIIEDQFLKPFRKRFMEDTMPYVADLALMDLAADRALKNGTEQQEEYDRAMKDYKGIGNYVFTFDSGTSPAVKQLRTKLMMAGIGAVNFQVDEIGSNLEANTDILTLGLELYDQGLVKQKLIKESNDNRRGEDLDTKTPTNMLLFGTPSKLLDGGKTEDAFYSLLDTGYARRCLFGYGQTHARAYESMTAEQIYHDLVAASNDTAVNKWAMQFHRLADPCMYKWKMRVEDAVGIRLIEYKTACEIAASEMPEHEEIRKAEMNHRYFKALKLAGAYAFVEESDEIELDHLMAAILLVEEAGKSFQHILNREKTYVKLAKYIAAVGEDVTHADLTEALPFYKSSTQARNEMMTYATAWGYKNHVMIKKSFIDGIEFFRGETLKETNLDEMIVSYSNHWAYQYNSEPAPFEQLHILTQLEDHHWCNHAFRVDDDPKIGGHRSEENVIPGFNMIVIDVDGGVKLETAHAMMADFKFMTYTTKRHSEDEHRFRLIIPMNYTLKLDTEEYKAFMNAVMAWLPFKTDESANQRAKKWESYAGGSYHYNPEGKILDVLDFIPKTSRNEEFQRTNQQLHSLDSLERWFAQRIAEGNRSNNMIKFAMALVDSGMTLTQVEQAVYSFNSKLNTPLPEPEIAKTIMVTVTKAYA